ncbi:hypothetical protein BJV74DRAFT_867052 [Russula compacta]|nr:hypothetical protein BJV74DRAFT_867052 [Russula compacta]
MTKYLPTAQVKKGDKNIHRARNLRDEWKDVIPSGDLTALQNRITMASEMRVGIDSKRGFPKLFHARAYRKYAKETFEVARAVSDRARDEEFSGSSYPTYDDSEQLPRTIEAAEATFRCYLSYKELFPTPEQESNWVKSVWPVACNKTGARLSPPVNLPARLAAVGPRFRGDVKTRITPLIKKLYGFETDKAGESQNRNMERARDLKRDRAFIDGENGLPCRHPIIQQAINAIWFDNRRCEGVMFPHEFCPMPYEATALVLTVIECCLDEWSGGPWIEAPFTSEHYKETYVEHLTALKALTSQGLNTRHCDPLYRLRRDLYNEGRRHAGVSPHVTSDGPQVWPQDKINAACEGLPDALNLQRLASS